MLTWLIIATYFAFSQVDNQPVTGLDAAEFGHLIMGPEVCCAVVSLRILQAYSVHILQGSTVRLCLQRDITEDIAARSTLNSARLFSQPT